MSLFQLLTCVLPGADAGATVPAAATSAAAAAGCGSTIGLRGLPAVIVGTLIVVDLGWVAADRRSLGERSKASALLLFWPVPSGYPLAFGKRAGIDRPRPGRGMGLDRRNRQRQRGLFLIGSVNQSNRLNRRDGGHRS